MVSRHQNLMGYQVRGGKLSIIIVAKLVCRVHSGLVEIVGFDTRGNQPLLKIIPFPDEGFGAAVNTE